VCFWKALIHFLISLGYDSFTSFPGLLQDFVQGLHENDLKTQNQ